MQKYQLMFLTTATQKQTFQSDLLRIQDKKLKVNATNHGWVMEKKYKMCIKCAHMSSNSLFQTFSFQGQLYFIWFFQKLKKKNTVSSFLLPLINSGIILEKFWVTFCFNVFKKDFWRKFLNKFPTVYNWIKCMSLEIALEHSNQMFSK